MLRGSHQVEADAADRVWDERRACTTGRHVSRICWQPTYVPLRLKKPTKVRPDVQQQMRNYDSIGEVIRRVAVDKTVILLTLSLHRY